VAQQKLSEPGKAIFQRRSPTISDFGRVVAAPYVTFPRTAITFDNATRAYFSGWDLFRDPGTPGRGGRQIIEKTPCLQRVRATPISQNNFTTPATRAKDTNMEELKRRRGRPPKPRASVLSPEAITRLRGNTLQTVETVEEAAARREKDRLRKQADRKQERVEKAVEGIETNEELWEMNLSLLPEAELSALLERESRVLDLLHWMDGAVAGTNLPENEDYVSVEEGAADLQALVKENGLATMEIILLGDFWHQPIYQERFQGTDGTSVFAKFGILTAFPDHRWAEWQRFLATTTSPTTPLDTPSGNGFTTMKCTTCNLLTGEASVPMSIAEAYQQQGKTFQCDHCRTIEAQSRTQSTVFQNNQWSPLGGSR